jgi:hypothetical protein
MAGQGPGGRDFPFLLVVSVFKGVVAIQDRWRRGRFDLRTVGVTGVHGRKRRPAESGTTTDDHRTILITTVTVSPVFVRTMVIVMMMMIMMVPVRATIVPIGTRVGIPRHISPGFRSTSIAQMCVVEKLGGRRGRRIQD